MKTEFNLIGKKIIKATINKISKEYDDEPYLDLEFEDGTKARIIADYRGYTGSSEDEYPRFIRVEENGKRI